MFSSLIICCNSSVLGLYKVFGFTWNMKKGRWNNSCLWRAAFVYFDLYAPNSYGCIGKVFPLLPYSLIFYLAICDLSSCKVLSFILQDFFFYFSRLYLSFYRTSSFILQTCIFYSTNSTLSVSQSYLFYTESQMSYAVILYLIIILSTISCFAISLYWYCESCSFVLQDLIFLFAKVCLLPVGCFLFLLEL